MSNQISQQFSERRVAAQRRFFCQHVAGDVLITSTVVYPATILPDGPARITNRSCDSFIDCNLIDKSACPAGVTRI